MVSCHRLQRITADYVRNAANASLIFRPHKPPFIETCDRYLRFLTGYTYHPPAAPMHCAPDTVTSFLFAFLPAILIGMAASGCAPVAATVENQEVVSNNPSSPPDPVGEELRSIRAQQLFVRGMTRAQTGNLGAALDLYAQALRMAPESPAILAASAELYEIVGDHVTAHYHLSKAYELAPQNIHYALQLAGLYTEMDERSKAARLYADVLDKAPHHLDARYNLARIYMMEGETAKAAAAYERILEENAGDRAVRRQLLHLYNRLDDIPNAERILEDMLEDEPHNADLRRIMAEIRLKQGRHEEAAENFLRILEKNPHDVQLWIYAANALRDAGSFVWAGNMAGKGLAIFPNALDLHKIAGHAAMAASSNAEAVRHFEEAVQIATENDYGNEAELGSLRSVLGSLYTRMGDIQRARQSYEEALRHIGEAASRPDASASVLENLGDVYEALGHRQSATDAWRRALEIDPNHLELQKKIDRK